MKAVQSAMAIRRQRRRRDDAVKAKARRSSHQSDHYMLSDSREGSLTSLDGIKGRRHQKMMGGVTTFHVGIVFFFIGLMLLISGLVPGYTNRQQYWEQPSSSSEGYGNAALLLATGSFLIMVGVVLVVVNRIASRKEDEQFTRYISRKLAGPARMSHHPVSSLQPIHHHHHESPAAAAEEEEESPAVNQLESITEESEGPSQMFWTSDVAPVHHHHHHHHHKHKHETESTGWIVNAASSPLLFLPRCLLSIRAPSLFLLRTYNHICWPHNWTVACLLFLSSTALKSKKFPSSSPAKIACRQINLISCPDDSIYLSLSAADTDDWSNASSGSPPRTTGWHLQIAAIIIIKDLF